MGGRGKREVGVVVFRWRGRGFFLGWARGAELEVEEVFGRSLVDSMYSLGIIGVIPLLTLVRPSAEVSGGKVLGFGPMFLRALGTRTSRYFSRVHQERLYESVF